MRERKRRKEFFWRKGEQKQEEIQAIPQESEEKKEK